MPEYKYTVGMTCSGCSGAVTRVLTKAQGVESFNVNLETQLVTVNSNALSQEQVLEIIRKTGKPAKVAEV